MVENYITVFFAFEENVADFIDGATAQIISASEFFDGLIVGYDDRRLCAHKKTHHWPIPISH